jgi:hypothetical protein
VRRRSLETVSELSTLLSTSVEGLRHLDPGTICIPSLLVPGAVCCVSHLEIHRVWCGSSLLGLQLHCPMTKEKEC